MKKPVFALIAALLFAPFAARAADGPLVMHYSLYAGGLGVVDLDMRYQLTPTGYDLNAEGRTKSFWRSLVPWRAHVQTRGSIEAGSAPLIMTPRTSVYDTIWRDKLKSVRMDFSPEGGVTVTNTPISNSKRVGPTTAQINGSIDPLGAVVLVLARTTAGEPGCSGAIPAYDGRRRFDLVLNSRGGEVLKKSGYSMFNGVAERCEITFKPIAGFSKKDEKSGFWSVRDNESTRSPLTIWLARVTPDGLVLPVRLQSDGSYGSMIAHLQSIDSPPPPTAP